MHATRKTARLPERSSRRLGLLYPVLTTALLTVLHALGIKLTTNDVVLHAWKVFYATSTHEHYTMLLEVVAFTWDVGPSLLSVRKAHTGNLTLSGVWLLWCGGGDLHAYTALKGSGYWHRTLTEGVESALEDRGVDLVSRRAPRLPEELVNRWHRNLVGDAALVEPSSSGDELTDNYVLLQAPQLVTLALYSGIDETLGCTLEACS